MAKAKLHFYLPPFIFLALDYFWIYDCFGLRYRYCYFGAYYCSSDAYYFSSATPTAVAALMSATAGATSTAAAPTSAAMFAAAAALGKLRCYQCERRMSTICLVHSFVCLGRSYGLLGEDLFDFGCAIS